MIRGEIKIHWLWVAACCSQLWQAVGYRGCEACLNLPAGGVLRSFVCLCIELNAAVLWFM